MRDLGQMYNPAHPGEVLKRLYMEPLDLSVRELADGLNVSRQTVSKIINGKNGVSPNMALKLSEAFGTSAELWLGMQQDYDLWLAVQNRDKKPVRKFHLGTVG